MGFAVDPLDCWLADDLIVVVTTKYPEDVEAYATKQEWEQSWLEEPY